MPAVVSPNAGTRTEPIDSLVFMRGTTATFKMVFTNNGVPTKVDTGTSPVAKVLAPKFLTGSDTPVPTVIATLTGSLVTGQEFEYEFTWDVPLSQTPLDTYVVTYEGELGNILLNFGDEYFTISAGPGEIGIRPPTYATVDDVRAHKFNIDSYLPEGTDLTQRNNLIEKHIRVATQRLREELSLFKQRGNSENYRLFCIFYTIWSVLLASRGEDGSSVSDQNIMFWRNEWTRILRQEKREGSFQGVPLGRG